MCEDQVLNRPVYQQGSSAVHSPRLPARAGWGRAQTRATVTTKSLRGQGIKHHILYDLTADTIIFHTQCSRRLKYGWERGEEGRIARAKLLELTGEINAPTGHLLDNRQQIAGSLDVPSRPEETWSPRSGQRRIQNDFLETSAANSVSWLL